MHAARDASNHVQIVAHTEQPVPNGFVQRSSLPSGAPPSGRASGGPDAASNEVAPKSTIFCATRAFTLTSFRPPGNPVATSRSGRRMISGAVLFSGRLPRPHRVSASRPRIQPAHPVPQYQPRSGHRDQGPECAALRDCHGRDVAFHVRRGNMECPLRRIPLRPRGPPVHKLRKLPHGLCASRRVVFTQQPLNPDLHVIRIRQIQEPVAPRQFQHFGQPVPVRHRIVRHGIEALQHIEHLEGRQPTVRQDRPHRRSRRGRWSRKAPLHGAYRRPYPPAKAPRPRCRRDPRSSSRSLHRRSRATRPRTLASTIFPYHACAICRPPSADALPASDASLFPGTDGSPVPGAEPRRQWSRTGIRSPAASATAPRSPTTSTGPSAPTTSPIPAIIPGGPHRLRAVHIGVVPYGTEVLVLVDPLRPVPHRHHVVHRLTRRCGCNGVGIQRPHLPGPPVQHQGAKHISHHAGGLRLQHAAGHTGLRRPRPSRSRPGPIRARPHGPLPPGRRQRRLET